MAYVGENPARISSKFEGHSEAVCSLSFSTDQPKFVFASSSEDGTVRLWDMRCKSESVADTCQPRLSPISHNSVICIEDAVLMENRVSMGPLKFSPSDTNSLFVANRLNIVELDLRKQKRLRLIELRNELIMRNLDAPESLEDQLEPLGRQQKRETCTDGDEDAINSFDISHDGRYLAIPTDMGDIIMYDLNCPARNHTTHKVFECSATTPKETETNERGFGSGVKNNSFRIMAGRHDSICGHSIFGKKETNVIFSGG